jgi:dTDP-4-amino-4,6-dideoxygalactose transaminase
VGIIPLDKMTNKNWKVPYIDLSLQFSKLENELTNEFKRVMKSGSFILRDDVKKFENDMAAYLGVKNVISVNSGTDALYLATEAINLAPGDEVITVAHSFVATLAAINRRGAKPILVDICDDFNINPEKIEEKITKNTKAIIPVHLNGRCCNMKKISAISEKYNLEIIEDVAQALGAKYSGKRAGSFGKIGCFSTHPMKTLSCAGDGGFISTNDNQIADKLKALRDHGQREKGEFLFFGYNSRLDNLQAAILNTKFKHLDRYINKRREIAKFYDRELNNLPLILPPTPSTEDFFDTYNSYVIRYSERDKLANYLKSKGIETFVHIAKPLYRHPGLKMQNLNLVNNEKICSEILSLPIYPEMTNSKKIYLVKSIKDFFIKNPN